MPVSDEKLRVFLSYRRMDGGGYAGRLFDVLSAQPIDIFMDIDTIEYGADFSQVIADALDECDVVIALIGSRWLDVTDAQGRRRIDAEDDYVRLELETALEHGVRIIPALVQGAQMPMPSELPASLSALCKRNAIELSDSRWQYDVQRLLTALHPPPSSRVNTSAAVKARPRRDLAGRDRELSLARKLLHEIVESGEGRVLLCEGPSGVGKTALVQEFAAIAESEFGFAITDTACEPFHEGISFFPIREIMRQAAQDAAATDVIANAYGRSSSAARIASVLEDWDGDPSVRREAIRATFCNLLFSCRRAGSRRVPLLVLLDDLEYIDTGSVDALLCLISRFREYPFLVLGSRRTAGTQVETDEDVRLRPLVDQASRADVLTTLELSSLPRADFTELVESVLGGPTALPQRFMRRLFQETEGNPLYVREILRSLAEPSETGTEASLERPEGVWQLTRDVSSWELPATVEEAIRARLGRLAATERCELETAAVVGRRFAFEVVEQLSASNQTDLLGSFERFLSLDLLREDPVRPEMFEFSHGKLRDVLYSSMLGVRRLKLHSEVADVLAQLGPKVADEDWDGLIGEHLFRARRYFEATPHILRAARAARAISSGAAAAELFGKALEAIRESGIPPDEREPTILLEQAEALKLSNQYSLASEQCTLLARMDDSEIKGWALDHLGDIAALQDRADDALDAYQEALAVARAQEDDRLILDVVADLVELHVKEAERLTGHDDAQAEHHERIANEYLDEQLRLAVETPDPVARARALRSRAKRERKAGDIDSALRSFEEAIALLDPRAPTHQVFISYAKTLRFAGRAREAEDVVARVLDWGVQTGNARAEAIARQYTGMLLMERGEEEAMPEAHRQLTLALRIHEEIGYGRGERETCMCLGEWHLLAGDQEPALEFLARATDSNGLSDDEVIRIAVTQLFEIDEAARAQQLAKVWAKAGARA